MKLQELNQEKQVIKTNTNEDYIYKRLLELLYNKQINKSKHITKIKYNYNYSDKQTIEFILDNKYSLLFIDIPTTQGSLYIK